MATKKLLSIEKPAKILIFSGEINPESMGDFLVKFHQADHTPGDIKIVVSSTGGMTECGIGMYDTIKSSKNRVITLGCGAVQSSAMLLFVAGDERFLQPGCRLLLHDGDISMDGVELKMAKSVFEEIENINEIYCQYVANSSKGILTSAKVADLCSRESFLSAQEAVDYGLADAVIKLREPKRRTP